MRLSLGAPIALLLALAPACSSTSAAGAAGPILSADGALMVDCVTTPSPPVQGLDTARCTVTSPRTGAPVDGLAVTVVPWMPAMGHGTSLVPTVTARGQGVYDIDPLSLFMGGEWELRLTFDGPVHDTANPAFDVP